MKFKDFYLSQNLIEISSNLNEISKDALLRATDKKRSKRERKK